MAIADTKVVVVGGSSGIGLGVAEAALAAGAEVIIAGRSQQRLDEAVARLQDKGAVAAHALDVTVESQVKDMFERIGSFDHLVVTRGVPPVVAPVAQFDLDAVRRFLDVMLVSSIALAKHAHRRIDRNGSITFTSGINKDKPPVPGGAVVAVVAGSFGFLAHQLALELAPVRVNVVSPGWVQTPMWDELVGPAKTGMWAQMAERLPNRRIATPGDIASSYLYLMESAFTTGTVLNVDGGHSLI